MVILELASCCIWRSGHPHGNAISSSAGAGLLCMMTPVPCSAATRSMATVGTRHVPSVENCAI